MRSTTRTTLVVAALLLSALLLIAGCVQGLKGLRFSHQLHAGEAECLACHSEAARAGHNACLECHEIDQENPSEACLLCHTEGDYRVQSVRPDGYADVLFAHDPHGEVACQTCHVDATGSNKAGSQDLPEMVLCLQCHDGEQAPAECSVCHAKVRVDQPPADHARAWDRSHGVIALSDRSACVYCHQESGCDDCHKHELPRSHTPAWKNSGHGLAAKHDRKPCATCHQADECSRCHQMKPATHYGADFRLPVNNASGHAGLTRQRGGAESCSVCHESSFCQSCHTW